MLLKATSIEQPISVESVFQKHLWDDFCNNRVVVVILYGSNAMRLQEASYCLL